MIRNAWHILVVGGARSGRRPHRPLSVGVPAHADQSPTSRGGAPALLKCSGTRRAFTLVELLVSLAVMSVALATIGVVFSVTTKTASQAAALSETQQWLRQFGDEIKADLEKCDPAHSVLVLVGREVPAALSEDDLQARRYYRELVGDINEANGGNFDPEFDPPDDNSSGREEYSDPRADIMMFFTQRALPSQAPPLNPRADEVLRDPAYLAGARFSPVQIVYGHAAFDMANGASFANDLDHIWGEDDRGDEISSIPASRWHLARRATIIEKDQTATPADAVSFYDGNEIAAIVRCHSDDEDYAGDVGTLDFPYYLRQFTFSENTNEQLALYRPYTFLDEDNNTEWPPNDVRLITELLYANASGALEDRHVATVIENPPLELASNVGLQMLPGCVWFQVEFLMPEDPRNGLRYDDPTPADEDDYTKRYDPLRWMEVEDGCTYVFVPDTAENRELVATEPSQPEGGDNLRYSSTGVFDFARINPQLADDASGPRLSNRDIRMWPYAIRITVRAIDPRGRLDQPLVRTIVHRFD